MSYLLDKKEKRKRFFRIAIGVIAFLVLFYFRVGIWGGFSFVSQGFFRSVLVMGNSLGKKIGDLGAYFVSKSSLSSQNENLYLQLREEEARVLNYNSVLAENESLKEILGRKNINKNVILGVILSKPNQSLYDTLVVDVGIDKGVEINDMVFALGNIPIGYITEVYSNSSKVVLFSNAGEKTQVILKEKNIFMEMIGRGGGNFEMIIPRDLVVENGDQVIMPGNNPYVLALVESTISDPRDPFTKVLLTSPVNVQELKFVQIIQ